MTSKSEIESLVYLLDDPDEFVRQSVLDRFNALDQHSIPLLDQIRVTLKDVEKRNVLDEVILKLTFPALINEFLNLFEGGLTSLEELEKAVLMLCRIENPTIREEIYVRRLNKMAAEIHAEILYTLQPVRQMEALIYHVFETHGFKAPDHSKFDPQEVQFSGMMDKRRGIPLSLTFVVLFLARRLELPFSGVNMPIHFLMRYDFAAQVVYLDPYNGGRPVSVDECLKFLEKNNLRPEQDYFRHAKPVEMLVRTLRNLHNAYQIKNDTLRLSIVDQFLRILSPSFN